MNIDWQDIAALAIAALCGGYLARQAWRAIVRRRAGRCGGCPSCPSQAGDPPLVTLQPKRDRTG
jgi:hypothetical protein